MIIITTKNYNQVKNINIKRNKYLLSAAICFLIYSIIEITDCISIVLISFNIIPNLYIDMNLVVLSDIVSILKTQPIVFFPFFLSFTLMRILSTIGIFRNRLWGFYVGIMSLILTMILTMIFIPFGFFEFFICTIILILLLLGYFGQRPIIK